ncbi:MAG: hypothetical protein ACOYEV_00140 [Candidatus Nanopelagicales bacterium]
MSRVLFLPLEIAGYVARLSGGLAERGWEVEALDLSGNPFGYESAAGTPLGLLGLLSKVTAHTARWPLPARLAARTVTVPLRLGAGLLEVPRYDALVYMYGRSLAWGWDLRLARRRGVRIVTVYLGSDSRPPYLDGAMVNRPTFSWPLLAYRTWRSARSATVMARYSDEVICHVPSAQFIPGGFVDWLAVGLPIPPPGEAPPKVPGETLRVLHSPSVPRIKGSAELAAVVAELREAGRKIDLRELTGVPNSVVLAAIDEADVVVDQLYSDTPLSGLACEAAARGTPVLTFGYAGDLLRETADPAIPLDHFQPPERLAEMLIRAQDDPAWLRELAARTTDFVRAQWSPDAVAGRFSRLLEGTSPAEWRRSREQARYALGCGISRRALRAVVREYRGRFGERALRLPAGSASAAAVEELLMIAGERPGPGGRVQSEEISCVD